MTTQMANDAVPNPGNENPNADNSGNITLIIAIGAVMGTLFLLVLVLFILFVLYYFRKLKRENEQYDERYDGRYDERYDVEEKVPSMVSTPASSRAAGAWSMRGPKADLGGGSVSRSASRPVSRHQSLRSSLPRATVKRSQSFDVKPKDSFQSGPMFLPGWAQSKSTQMTSRTMKGSLDNLHRGIQNKGYVDYEGIDREFWNHTKGGEGAITQNPAFGKDEALAPIDVNLHLRGFDNEEEDVDSGMVDVSPAEETNQGFEFEALNNESNQIQILDMSTWSSPSTSPVAKNAPTAFTISSQVNQQDKIRDRNDFGVDFSRAHPLRASASDISRLKTKAQNQSVVDFYENASPGILGQSMEIPADAYGSGRRLLWQKKHFDAK